MRPRHRGPERSLDSRNSKVVKVLITHIVVRPFAALSNASCTTLSDCESSADVASSKRRILGLRIRARAIAIRCFWPLASPFPLTAENGEHEGVKFSSPDRLTVAILSHRLLCQTRQGET